MAEWLKAHAWKACIPQGIQGSNPCLSAIKLPASHKKTHTLKSFANRRGSEIPGQKSPDPPVEVADGCDEGEPANPELHCLRLRSRSSTHFRDHPSWNLDPGEEVAS